MFRCVTSSPAATILLDVLSEGGVVPIHDCVEESVEVAGEHMHHKQPKIWDEHSACDERTILLLGLSGSKEF